MIFLFFTILVYFFWIPRVANSFFLVFLGNLFGDYFFTFIFYFLFHSSYYPPFLHGKKLLYFYF